MTVTKITRGALAIPKDGLARVISLDGIDPTERLTPLCEVIGGGCHELEPVSLTNRLVMWMDCTALQTQEHNPFATALTMRYDEWRICKGTVVLCADSPEGQPCDLDNTQLISLIKICQSLVDHL